MTTMESISWVGDMYQKFESLCGEAEETMYEDTVKYVEDRMRSVGESVKKFYTDVIEDLIPLPPSSVDSVQDDDPVLTVVHHADVAASKKPIVNNVKGYVDTEAKQMLRDSDGAVNGDNIVNFGGTTEEQCTNEDLERRCSEFELSNLATSATKDLYNRQDSTCKSISDTSSISANVTDNSGEKLNIPEAQEESNDSFCGIRDVNSNSVSVSEVSHSEDDAVATEQMTVPSCGDTSPDFNVSSTKTDLEATITNYTQSTEDVHMEPFVSDTEVSNRLVGNGAESGDGGEHGFLLGEQLDKVKLGESCVLVEKSEHCSTLPLEHEKKSYKKKIRDAFTMRRWSKGKRDQEQLAVWYEELNGNNLVPTITSVKDLVPTTTSMKDSQSVESFESEWELL